MSKDSAQIGISVFLMLVCTAVGIKVWSSVFIGIQGLIHLNHPYLIAIAFLGIINTGHFLWGFFHTDADTSDIPTDGLMTLCFNFYRIIIRIIALLTIGPSIYLKRAIEYSRDDKDEQASDASSE